MEQYLLQVPEKVAQEIRKKIQDNNLQDLELTVGADNKHFTLNLNQTTYPAVLKSLPCIIESHKTFDQNVFYKSADIGQIFIVAENEDELKQIDQEPRLGSGITPPTTNIVRRKYSKTRKHGPFPKEEVARVEEDVVKLMQGGPVELIEEDLVEFEDWMVNDKNPTGITITNEMEFIKTTPQYLDLVYLDPKKNKRSKPSGFQTGNTSATASATASVNVSAHASTAGSPAPASPRMQREDVDDELEEDLFGDLESEPSGKKQEQEQKRKKLESLPRYQELMATSRRHNQRLVQVKKEVEDLQKKVDSNTNIVVKARFEQSLKQAQQTQQEIEAEIASIAQQVQSLENEL